ncbi:sodium pump decarboxylase, gamma subunit [Psychromonas ingrahamii 37]|uniref:Probable oxaloacetate decarboxylase gamma chain n=1 Tax=Psychromonas ingrahamii (strain DSM 17664 / CCUG 51855 / 37) TaxID=357804 RepID=A1SZZ8_PSYIN|nr:oxaloacetate decarboxylase subunit gamma [Psychromonas ingrahamii]ABM05063.1 sodium pump decarboxylase, gamma subunit [Psychromonas ingrahamii 37]
MDITQLLFTALQLLGLGMGFVFLFLGLLMVIVNLMAKYIPQEQPVADKKRAQQSATESAINPAIIAAITTAVHQYHKTKTAQ